MNIYKAHNKKNINNSSGDIAINVKLATNITYLELCGADALSLAAGKSEVRLVWCTGRVL